MFIDANETFPILQHVPVTEAVLEIRTVATSDWAADSILPQLRTLLPDYPDVEARRELRAEFKFSHEGAQVREAEAAKWKGILTKSEDGLNVGRFEDELFSFSRLSPYSDWESFTFEGRRLWEVYKKVAHPQTVARLGVRFINRILIPLSSIQIEDYLVSAPKEPEGMEFPYINFLYRDIMAVPDSDYIIRITRSLGQLGEGEAESVALVVDVDVSTARPFDDGESLLSEKLREIRWLKNKAFFGSIRKAALALIE